MRIALGAGGGDVTRLVMRDAMATILGGTLVGLPCAYGVARTVETLLFQVRPLDPWSALFAVATLLTVAAAAAWVPARRAARVDPLVALRDG